MSSSEDVSRRGTQSRSVVCGLVAVVEAENQLDMAIDAASVLLVS